MLRLKAARGPAALSVTGEARLPGVEIAGSIRVAPAPRLLFSSRTSVVRKRPSYAPWRRWTRW